MISVIIPTYNRSKQLLKTLKSLQKQNCFNFEILVVDNAADRKIKQLIVSFNKKAKKKARYIPEPKLGLQNARHTGIKKATYSLLVLLEDELTFVPNFIKSYLDAFKKNPQMVAAGGPLKPYWEAKPSKETLSLVKKAKTFPPFSLLDYGKKFIIGTNVSFFGGNMAIKKETLYEFGGFNPEYYDKILLGDGESGLNKRLIKNNQLIGYVPGATVYHHIDKDRMSVKSIIHWMDNQGRADIYTIFHENGVPKNWFGLIKHLPSLVFLNLKYWLGTFFIKSPKAPFLLNFKMLSTRTIAQLKYIREILKNKKLQRLIRRKNWLIDKKFKVSI